REELFRWKSRSIAAQWIRLLAGALTAHADEIKARTKPVTVELEWEEVEGAAAYQVQISSTTDFKNVLINSRTDKPLFDYRTQAQAQRTQKLFFRVASIDEEGVRGEF